MENEILKLLKDSSNALIDLVKGGSPKFSDKKQGGDK